MLKRIEKKDEYGHTIICTVDENGVEQGAYEEHWCDNLEKGTFKDGKKEGPYEFSYANGVTGRGTYKDGKQDGLVEGFYENGQLKYRYHYKDGRLEGEAEEYYSNGQLMRRELYKEGDDDAELLEEYYENGQATTRFIQDDDAGDVIVEKYYEDGKISERYYMRDGKLDGPDEFYDRDGKLEDRSIYIYGVYSEGKSVESYLEKWQKAREERKEKHEKELKRAEAIGGLRGQLKLLSDPAFRKQIGKARTPERQAKAEEIVEVRRARTLLSRAANKAIGDGDKELFSEIEKVAKPYALHHRRIELEFKKKRAERRSVRKKQPDRG